MDSGYYEERTPLKRFKLEHMADDYFGQQATDVMVEGMYERLLFMHIKYIDVADMRFAYELPNNDITPKLCFIDGWYEGALFKRQFKHVADTSIFVNGIATSSLDRFVNLINDNIDIFVSDCKTDNDKDTKVNGKMLYGHFTIENNKLQFIYKYDTEYGEDEKIAVLGFNKPFLDIILKYFDVHVIAGRPETFYYIRPGFHETNLVDLPKERIVTAYRDTTDFFFPTHKIKVEISNTHQPRFVDGELGYKTNAIPFNLQKSHIEFDKYILLADKETTRLRVNWRLTVDQYIDNNSVITGEAEYIVLKDMFDQFNMFKLHIGDIYSAEEYKELSYRKLMGITANTVYLQNSTSTELLTKLLARLEQHYPDIGGNRDISLWQSIRDLVGDKETLDEIYKLLYHAYPQEPYGPQSKKIKIDF